MYIFQSEQQFDDIPWTVHNDSETSRNGKTQKWSINEALYINYTPITYMDNSSPD